MSVYKKAILALIIANVIWGAAFPIYKWSLEEIKPFTFVFLRFFLGALVLLPFTITKLKVERKDLFMLFIMSFFGITFCISFLFLGLELSSSINAPIVLSSSPMLLLALSIIFLHKKPTRKVVIGAVVGLLGVLIIVLRPVFESGFSSSILGNFFLLLAAVGSALHVIFLKKIAHKYDPLTLAFWSFIIGAIPVIPLAFIEVQSGFLATIDGKAGLGLVFAVFLATAVAHWLNGYGIKYIPASEVGVFTYIDPIATILVALPLLGETITITYIIGSVFVFLGIFIAEERFHWHPLHKLLN